MNTRFQPKSPAWSMVVGPPLVSTAIFGLAGELIGLTFAPEQHLAAAGAGLIIGLVFGSSVWSSLMTSSWKQYASITATPIQRIPTVQRIELRVMDPEGKRQQWHDFDLPPDVTFGALVRMAELVVENDYLFRGHMFWPKRLPYKPMTRPEYESIRLLLEKHRIVERVTPGMPNSALRVCAPVGKRFFRRLSRMDDVEDLDRTSTPQVLSALVNAAKRR